MNQRFEIVKGDRMMLVGDFVKSPQYIIEYIERAKGGGYSVPWKLLAYLIARVGVRLMCDGKIVYIPEYGWVKPSRFSNLDDLLYACKNKMYLL